MQKYKLIINIEQFRAKLEEYIEAVSLVAKIQKAVYDSYIEKGFTKKQALKLSKKLFRTKMTIIIKC